MLLLRCTPAAHTLLHRPHLCPPFPPLMGTMGVVRTLSSLCTPRCHPCPPVVLLFCYGTLPSRADPVFLCPAAASAFLYSLIFIHLYTTLLAYISSSLCHLFAGLLRRRYLFCCCLSLTLSPAILCSHSPLLCSSWHRIAVAPNALLLRAYYLPVFGYSRSACNSFSPNSPALFFSSVLSAFARYILTCLYQPAASSSMSTRPRQTCRIA